MTNYGFRQLFVRLAIAFALLIGSGSALATFFVGLSDYYDNSREPIRVRVRS